MLNPSELKKIDAYWRASNYLAAGQLYLLDNPMLRRPLTRDDVKKKIVGHWGTVPGQNFVYVHLNRVIKKYDQDMILISGPGHGGNFFVANAYLDGTYSEVYPNISRDEEGMKKLFKQFSFPGGISSHVAPETPGSINEGGELGYSIAHAFGAVFDNPDLICAVTVGDGEAETGPLATSWQSNKFLNPVGDGAVLPILHLNGYKISNPTIFGRMTHEEMESFFRGCSWKPYFVEGDDPMTMHEKMAETLDTVIEEIHDIQKRARAGEDMGHIQWPMIVLRTPKGWTGPKVVDGKPIEGTFRAHQVPIDITVGTPNQEEHLKQIEEWLHSYHAEELFDENGTLIPELQELAPTGDRRLAANPHANGGKLLRDLRTPDFKQYAVDIPFPGSVEKQDMIELGGYIRDVLKLNADAKNFRIFGPDETMSNRLYKCFEATQRDWNSTIIPGDEFLAHDGRIMDSMLSEHMCEGWLEGYLLTGRHGIWSSYESFVHVIDSMLNQHAKWLEATVREIPWRKPISSMNLLVSSHVWRQDHNGFSHQDPGVTSVLLNKCFNNDHVIGIYFPVDSNMLLAVAEKCYKSTNKINAIIAGKQPAATWLTLDEARAELEKGAAEWKWASNVKSNDEAQIVLAATGDVPTQEIMAAADKLDAMGIKFKVVNVVDLVKLQSAKENNEALSDEEFAELFTEDKPVLFAYHSYARDVRGLIYDRPNHDNFNVHGYEEQGSTTTPYDMVRVNNIDRYELQAEALRMIDADKYADKINELEAFRQEAFQFAVDNGYDHPDYTDWVYSGVNTNKQGAVSATAATAGDNE